MDPHVLIFPMPLQSPINSHLKLAELLCHAGIRVTFVNTEHMHHRLLRHTNILTRFSVYPNIHFLTFPDGLPQNHKRCGDACVEMIESVEAITGPLLRNYLADHSGGGSKVVAPVTCIIAEGTFSWVVDIAQEVNIPLLSFETISPCALWIHICLPKLIQAGQIPLKGNDLDGKITLIPSMENFLRRRDLPEFCRGNDLSTIQSYLNAAQQLPRAQGLILNTYEHLDERILPQIRTRCPNLYAIGPIHALYKLRITQSSTHSNSLFKEDTNCLLWLDTKPLKSVIFVSIGSHASMTKHQSIELWYGLVNSGRPFLWAKRRGSIVGEEKEVHEHNIPIELIEGTKERGCVVEWAPQEEVLAHRAIGVFLTHSGWSSTLESVVEGIPLICWPCFFDQQVTSRFVSEVWKIGMDMKDSCDRKTIEKMVKIVMESKKDEFNDSVGEMAEKANQSIRDGGKSNLDFNRLIHDLKLFKF